jgi:hypothetical protein
MAGSPREARVAGRRYADSHWLACVRNHQGRRFDLVNDAQTEAEEMGLVERAFGEFPRKQELPQIMMGQSRIR